jgi:hypothetical protein
MKLYQLPKDTWFVYHNPYTNKNHILQKRYTEGAQVYCEDKFGNVTYMGSILEVTQIKSPELAKDSLRGK